jgi:two-component system osmolarity sensor histidine kinase EnvZ
VRLPLPSSLLWRTVLLLVPLLVASQLAWFTLTEYASREPRARQIAERAATVVNLTRAALVGSQPERRRALLAELDAAEGIRVYPDDAVLPEGELASRPVVGIVVDELQRRLGPDTVVYTARGDEPGLWVSFAIDGDRFWVELPAPRERSPFPWRWFAWGLAVLALSIVGAWLIMLRTTRGLRAAVPAAEALGRGEQPPALPETGPAEVAALGRAFNGMASGLRQLAADRQVLLAGVSHDLRTPLARLRLAIEMLPGDDTRLASGMAEDIADMDAIIDQFLAYAREDIEAQPLVEMRLDDLCAQSVERARRAGAAVDFMAGATAPIRLRALSMRRLVDNLLDNAQRHGAPPVELRTSASGEGWLRLQVLDRGPGIAAGDRTRAFAPFERLDPARGGRGSGLGLAVVERIARAHGGRVSLSARDGGGLAVTVDLPIDPGAVPPPP